MKMASSSCGYLLFTRCLRDISSKYSFSTSPNLSTLSKKLLLTNGVIYKTTVTHTNVWETCKWRSFAKSMPTLQSNLNEEQLNKEAEERKRIATRQWKITRNTLIVLVSIFSFSAGYVLLSCGKPLKDENGEEVKDEYSNVPIVKAYFSRAWREVLHYNKMLQEPSREKLLPDLHQDPLYQPPYTLVLEMTDLLVHPDWTYKTGWRFKKRPGVDYFLQQVGTVFEVVVYTSEQGMTAFPILDSLDPNGFIMYKLFRDATRYLNGHHVKDLSCLNRDLSKVIMVDWNASSVQFNPENALHIKKWSGNDDDSTLFDLANFLKTLAISEVEDVRKVLQYYQQFDDPILAFKENQKRLQEEENKLLNDKGSGGDHQAPLPRSWSSILSGRRR